METIKYTSPKESTQSDEFKGHSIDYILDGVKVGSAEINYFSKPLSLYQITDLYVDADQSGRGYASRIMDKVEEFLRERKKPGVLVDAIDLDSPAHGMYERRGWKPGPEGSFLWVYNWPSDVDLDILKGYPDRYTDPVVRHPEQFPDARDVTNKGD